MVPHDILHSSYCQEYGSDFRGAKTRLRCVRAPRKSEEGVAVHVFICQPVGKMEGGEKKRRDADTTFQQRAWPVRGGMLVPVHAGSAVD